MFKNGKKIRCALVALALLASMIASAAISVSAESTPVNILLHNCDAAANISASGGFTASVDSTNRTEGSASVTLRCSNGNATFWVL